LARWRELNTLVDLCDLSVIIRVYLEQNRGILMSEETQEVFNFPCSFPLKAVGLDIDEFEAFVVSVVRRHVTGIDQGMVSSRASSGVSTAP
jgi:hypothetical protein